MDDGTGACGADIRGLLALFGAGSTPRPVGHKRRKHWLGAHVRMFAFLDGVPAKVVPDNLKVGVTHASYYAPVINASYAGLIKHYGTAVVPARSRKPRDKPGVENGVLQACRWLLAPLRHRQFFSLAELNQAICAAAPRAERQADGTAARGQPA